jgi:SagB-type dehydrogenase family enzyme
VRLGRRAFLGLGAAALGAWSLRRCEAPPARESAAGIHRATRNTRLGALGPRLARPERQQPLKPYPGVRRVALPPEAGDPGRSLEEVVRARGPVPARAQAAVDAAQLSRLLRLANGVTGRVETGAGPVLLRAAPSAGRLYAGEVYLVAERVEGVAPGVYYYSVPEHALVELAPGPALGRVRDAVEWPSAVDGAAAAVLLTNVFARYTGRYANRGYRYALLDSGHIGENLRLACGALGLAGPLLPRFQDDALDALLAVDGRSEAACALHVVGGSGPGAGGAARRDLVEQQDIQRWAPAGTSAIEGYHEATKLVRASGEPPPSAPAPRPELPAVRGSPVRLPRRDRDPGRAVASCIEARRSARRFLADPLALEDLSFALEMAAGEEGGRNGAVGLLLAVHRVQGLAPGLYAYDPGAHALGALREGDLRAPLAGACLGQEKAASAAVAFFMLGALGPEGARGGARRYRDLLLEAGAIGQRVYLAAEALGVAARNLAAFVDDALAPLLGLGGRDAAVLHLTVLGPGD